ncbi:MAG: TIR domain-containing protein [Frankia sp.]
MAVWSVVARIFVSHASADLSIAVGVRDWLQDDHHQVFLDRDLREGVQAGEVWKRRLYRELRAADAVVCIVTRAYIQSEWCCAEIGIADAVGSRLMPLRAEPGVTSKLLEDRQYVDWAQDGAWRDQIGASLRGIDAAGGLGWDDAAPPFPGLRPFEVGMARIFRGRADETRRLAGRLRTLGESADAGLLLVVGPSGCGKSSLVRAGLVARMAGEPGWDVVHPFPPGVEPTVALARALTATANRAGLGWTVERTRTVLARDDGLARLSDDLLVAGPGPARERLLVVIDQGEELLTRADEQDRTRFAALLRVALTGTVRVVVTLRSEFVDGFVALPELADLSVETFAVRPLGHDMLRVVIEEPARLAGLDIDRELVERLVADTDRGEALPLLAFTLRLLADGLSRGAALSGARYDQIGGVRGALARQADDALAAAVVASGLPRDRVLAYLTRLASLDEAGRRTGRRLEIDGLNQRITTAIAVFVDRRLLTSARDDQQGGTVGVAHEALFTAWPPLDAAISGRAVALRTARSAEQAAAEWNRVGRRDDHLWDRGRAIEANRALDADDLAPRTAAFLRSSRRRGDRRRIWAIGVLSAFLVFVTLGGLVALGQWRSAAAQRGVARAERQLAVSRQLVGEALALRDSQPRAALALAIEAYDLAPSLEEARGSLLGVQATYYGATMLADRGAVHAVAYEPDGRLAATAQHDHAVCLWTMPVRRLDTCLPTSAAAYGVAFSPDGATLAAAGADGTVTVWRTADRRRLAVLRVGAAPVNALAFSPDGRTFATAGEDGAATLWTTAERRRVGTLVTGSGPLVAIAFSPDGSALAGAGSSGVTVWPARAVGASAGPPPGVEIFTGFARAVAFSPDGRGLAVGGASGGVTILDAHSHAQLATVTEHTGRVTALVWSPDSRSLASGGVDASVRLWDVSSQLEPLVQMSALTGPTLAVLGLAFSPDGRTLLAADGDGVLGGWNVGDRPDDSLPEVRGAALFAPSAIGGTGAPSGPGGTLATAGRDHQPVLWHTRGVSSAPEFAGRLSGLPRPSGPPPAAPFGLAFNATGTMLAAPATDNSAVVWRLADPARPRTLPGARSRPVRAVAFQGDLLAAASDTPSGDVDLWNLATEKVAVRLAPIHYGAAVNAVAVTGRAGAMTVITGGDEGLIAASDRSGRPAQVFYEDRVAAAVEAITVNHAGTTLVTGSDDGTVQLWDVATRKPLATLVGGGRPVVAVSLSADDRLLATADTDGVIRIWNTQDHSLYAAPVARPGTTAVAFAPDGAMFATSDQAGTPVLWDTDPGRVRARLCATGQPPHLTAQEWAARVPDEPFRRGGQVCPS